MQQRSSRKRANGQWPRKVRLGRVSVTVYRRKTPGGHTGYLVSNYSSGKRRLDSYATEEDALQAANDLARKLSKHEVVAASMTNHQASEYAAAADALSQFKVGLSAAASTVAECLKLVGDLPNLHAAAKFYAQRHKKVEPKAVSKVVTEMIDLKRGRGASERYLQDLDSRLTRFSEDFQKDICNVTTSEIQGWLDRRKVGRQSYKNFRTVLNSLFEFAVARGYAVDNPVIGVEKIKVNGSDVEIFTPEEIARLLAAASPSFVPCIAIGAFAGLRSAEIERLEWSDVDLVGGHITIGAKKAKTASRRVVAITDNLGAWLAPYSGKSGLVWSGSHEEYYEAQQDTAAATEVKADPDKGIKVKKPVKWKANGLRHSYASYRFAQTGDAGRVAGELGNSAAVVHKHYRELVKPVEAERWFSISPQKATNITSLSTNYG